MPYFSHDSSVTSFSRRAGRRAIMCRKWRVSSRFCTQFLFLMNLARFWRIEREQTRIQGETCVLKEKCRMQAVVGRTVTQRIATLTPLHPCTRIVGHAPASDTPQVALLPQSRLLAVRTAGEWEEEERDITRTFHLKWSERKSSSAFLISR